MTREALEGAMNALIDCNCDVCKDRVIEAIRAYLAQPAPTSLRVPDAEPVAWMHSKTGNVSVSPYDLSLADGDETAIPLYEVPPLSEAEIQDLRAEALRLLDKAFPELTARQDHTPCNKDPRGCWNVRCQLGKACINASEKSS